MKSHWTPSTATEHNLWWEQLALSHKTLVSGQDSFLVDPHLVDPHLNQQNSVENFPNILKA